MLHGISKSAVKRMIKHVFRQADAVTAPTKELAEELRSYGLRNVTYIPDGVDYGKLKCTKNAVRRFRKSHRIPNGKKIVLYLGRLSFEKNVDTLLEAFKRIERDDRVLLVAGGGPYLKRFKELAHDLRIKNIIFTGFVEGIGSAYSCGDIFVSASQSETFGLTFVEAMHFGLPAVGTRKFGPQELIKDGKTGFLVKPGSMVELANAMDKLLDDDGLRSRMSKAAVESSKDYSIGKSIAATTKLYKKLKRSGLPSQ
jgi:glycosyltransferase involved in cell wall biosynthesis